MILTIFSLLAISIVFELPTAIYQIITLHTPILRPLLPGKGLTMDSVPVIPISASRSMVIMEDGTLWTWGFHVYQFDKIMEDATAVFSGGNSSLILTSDGTLWIFGDRIRGLRHWALRAFVPDVAWEPEKIMYNVVDVSMGGGCAFAITSDGVLWGWGRNIDGQLGDGTTTDRPYPIKIMEDVIAVSAGSSHTMAITSDGTLWGWGRNLFDDGTTTNQLTPIEIMEDVVAVSGTFVITSDSTLWHLGPNWRGLLEDGTEEVRPSPEKIMEDVIAVSAGRSHVMAITSDSGLWAWGNNGFEGSGETRAGRRGLGKLGDGTTESRSTPVRIMEDVVAVSAGSDHTMAVTSDGALWTWGDNQFGRLGDDTYDFRSVPGKVLEGVLLP